MTVKLNSLAGAALLATQLALVEKAIKRLGKIKVYASKNICTLRVPTAEGIWGDRDDDASVPLVIELDHDDTLLLLNQLRDAARADLQKLGVEL